MSCCAPPPSSTSAPSASTGQYLRITKRGSASLWEHLKTHPRKHLKIMKVKGKLSWRSQQIMQSSCKAQQFIRGKISLISNKPFFNIGFVLLIAVCGLGSPNTQLNLGILLFTQLFFLFGLNFNDKCKSFFWHYW